AELDEVVFAVPVRLADHADAKALGLRQPSDDRHAERRMIYVSIASDDDHVARIPAELIHLLPAHRQKRCWTEAFGPVFRIVKQRLGGVHGKKPGQRKRARNIAQKMTSMPQWKGRKSLRDAVPDIHHDSVRWINFASSTSRNRRATIWLGRA